MSSITFVTGTIVPASWLNDVNTVAYGVGGNAGQRWTADGAGGASWQDPVDGGTIDHGDLIGLTDDDHTQYVLVTDLEADRATVANRWNELTSEASTELHRHPDTHIDRDAYIGSPTFTTQSQWNSINTSAGHISGGTISDAGGETIDVAAGQGLIRGEASDTGDVYTFDWPAASGIAVPTDTIQYVAVEYNGGTPQVALYSSETYDYRTAFPLGVVINDGGTLYIQNVPHPTGRAPGRQAQRVHEVEGRRRADRLGGLILGETGTRNVTVSAGVTWHRYQRDEIAAIDTSGSDTFTTWWRDGGGDWNSATGVTQWPNGKYDNNSGTLADMTNNNYGNLWFYLGGADQVHMVYGRTNDPNIANALAKSPPADVPLVLQEGALLLGRIVFQEGGSTAEDIETAFTTIFSSTGVTDHGQLAGLSDNDHPQYLLVADIDDTPVDGVVDAPISSNWAYDHVAAADPHTGYRLESADHNHQSTGLQGGQLDHGAALTGLSDDDHTQYALLAGRSGGQTIIGGTGANDGLTLNSTSNSTKGVITIGNSGAGSNVIIGGGTAASELRFMEPSGSGTNYTAFKAQAQSGNVTYTLPAADGSADQVLKTNGSGTLSWVTSTALTDGDKGDITVSSSGSVWTIDNSTISPAKLDATALAKLYATVGQCRFEYTSTSVCTLNRFNGKYLFINGVLEEIPATAPTIANTALGSNDTTYYVYAYMNSGTMTLEVSTTAYATDSTYGHKIKSGDGTRSLVGMVRKTGGNFFDAADARFVRSWFNEPSITLIDFLGAEYSIAAAPYFQINSNFIVLFLAWAGESVNITYSGVRYDTTSGSGYTYTAIGYDSTTSAAATNFASSVGANVYHPSTVNYATVATEGYHYVTGLAGYSGGSTPKASASDLITVQLIRRI